MAYGTVNADVISTSVANTSLGAGNATRFKNRIINGDMRIDQRNAGASSSAINTYTVDRWAYYASQSGKLGWQQNSGSVTPPAGFSNYLGFASASAYSVTSSDYFIIRQPIEGFNTADLAWGTINAKTVTLSAWVYSSATGTFGGALRNYAANRSYPFTYTISSANTWTQISVTIPGDTTGTWVGATNSIGLNVTFGMGVGTTYSGPAGAWAATDYNSATGAVSVVGTNGATFYITGVQLEVGSSATGFEYVDYGVQLQMCMRYAEVLNGPAYSMVLPGNPSIGTQQTYSSSFLVPKRTAATISYLKGGTGYYQYFNGSSYVDASPQYLFGSTDGWAYVGTGSQSNNMLYRINGTIFIATAEL